MPWKVLSQMELKMQLVRDWNEKHMNVTDLAQQYHYSLSPRGRGSGHRQHSSIIIPSPLAGEGQGEGGA